MAPSIIGQTIDGKYTIRRAIGEGAMGAVFIATDQYNEPVALKLLKRVDKDLKGPERFAREVRFLRELEHPNVVDLIAYGRDDDVGVLYFAMELLFGDPVAKLVEHGRTSPALALMVARQAAEGIDSAHRRGIVHRDLKPANLMLVPRPDGTVQLKILDFGLAYVASEKRLTGFGSAPGTVSYMPPEQLNGQDVDLRGDIYGLGVVLFEMMSGRQPFRGGTQVDLAMSVMKATPPRLDKVCPDVPSSLADLVVELLSKNPESRPQTAEALVDRIAAFQRSSSLRPIEVSHTGPTRDPVSAWNLQPPVDW